MYNFLQKLTLVDTKRVRAPKQKNPEGMTIRIFPNGEVYPSQELVDKFNLEYKADRTGNGIDVVDSKQWTPLENEDRMILLAITPKSEPKVDLFAQCRYDKDGNPMSTVMKQGSTSEILLTLVKELGYLTPEQKYCDLELGLEWPVGDRKGIFNLPKVIERGERKGEKTYERRENVLMIPANTPENMKVFRQQASEPSNALVTTETEHV